MASTAATQLLGSPIIAFVEANEPTSADEEFIFGQIDGATAEKMPDMVHKEHFEDLLRQAREIRSNSGVGSPEVAKYVDAQAPSLLSNVTTASALRSLAEQLHTRRPVLYLKGHPEPLPATVLLRTARKPSGALSAAVSPGGLFKSPDNNFIVIKFDPQFGYADIIVDPFFTDAFIQQPSNPTYNALLAALPRAFVGTAAELRKMVALLTAESIKAYAEKGVSCPPWRRFDAMIARWLPRLFTDNVITHGPGAAAASRPAAAALNPSLFNPAAPSVLDFSRVPLQRGDSADSSTVRADSSDVSGTSPSAAFNSDDFSSSLSSSSSSSVGSFGSSRGSSVVGHNVIYGFEIPGSKQQQQQQQPEVVVVADAGTDAEPTAGVAANPEAAVVASKLAQASAADSAAAATASDDSIKAVYPAAMPSAAIPGAAPPAERVTKQQQSLLASARKQQLKRGLNSSDSITTRILAANGYGRPRVVKLGGSGNGPSHPGAAAAGVRLGTATTVSSNQRVCCGTPVVRNGLYLERASTHTALTGPHTRGPGVAGIAAGGFSTRSVASNTVKANASALGGTGEDTISAGPKADLKPKQFPEGLAVFKGVDVKGLPTAVAEYKTAVLVSCKDTVLRLGMGGDGPDSTSSTRVVAGRKVVKLASSPARNVVQGFMQEGARAA